MKENERKEIKKSENTDKRRKVPIKTEIEIKIIKKNSTPNWAYVQKKGLIISGLSIDKMATMQDMTCQL